MFSKVFKGVSKVFLGFSKVFVGFRCTFWGWFHVFSKGFPRSSRDLSQTECLKSPSSLVKGKHRKNNM